MNFRLHWQTIVEIPIENGSANRSTHKIYGRNHIRFETKINYYLKIYVKSAQWTIKTGVQVIKMYAWEKPFAELVSNARRMELKIIRKTSFVRGLYMTFVLFTTRAAVFCTMLAIALLYGSDQITADKVFVVSSYFRYITLAPSHFVLGWKWCQ